MKGGVRRDVKERKKKMNGDEKSMLKSKTLMKKPMSRGASNNHELSISFFLSICLSENTLLLYAHRIIGIYFTSAKYPFWYSNGWWDRNKIKRISNSIWKSNMLLFFSYVFPIHQTIFTEYFTETMFFSIHANPVSFFFSSSSFCLVFYHHALRNERQQLSTLRVSFHSPFIPSVDICTSTIFISRRRLLLVLWLFSTIIYHQWSMKIIDK